MATRGCTSRAASGDSSEEMVNSEAGALARKEEVEQAVTCPVGANSL